MHYIVSIIVVVAALTAGSAMLMWLGERITENGVGNGISIVLLINIISGMPSDFATLYSTFVAPRTIAKGVLAAAIIIAILVVMVVLVCFYRMEREEFLFNIHRRLVVESLSADSLLTFL